MYSQQNVCWDRTNIMSIRQSAYFVALARASQTVKLEAHTHAPINACTHKTKREKTFFFHFFYDIYSSCYRVYLVDFPGKILEFSQIISVSV